MSSSNGGWRGEKKKPDKYSLALDRLHARAVPKSLPCRDEEKKTMLDFLRSNVKSGKRARQRIREREGERNGRQMKIRIYCTCKMPFPLL